jgi:hypothetical protein
MPKTHRIIVTGRNAAGKSLLVEDIQAGVTAQFHFDFWQTKAGFAPEDLSVGRSAMKFFPEAGGTMFRLFTIPPAGPKLTPKAIADLQDEFFKEIGSSAARVDTTRHPLMHTTPTVDYILLLAGQISLLLDEGDPIKLKPFDSVVQRATNHSWINTGLEPALLMAVMVGAPEEKKRR